MRAGGPTLRRVVIAVTGGCIAAGSTSGILSVTLGRASCISPEFYEQFFADFLTTVAVFSGVCGLVIAFIGGAPRPQSPVRRALLNAGLISLFIFVTTFSLTFLIAAMPPVTRVSACFAFRPWWRLRNWIFSIVPSLSLGLLIFSAGVGERRRLRSRSPSGHPNPRDPGERKEESQCRRSRQTN